MKISDFVAAFALLFSAYSLWETSLKGPHLTLFVPPVIRYASPYQNSNFEAFAIPVTIANEGARAGIVVSMALVVTDPAKKLVKRFYSAALGPWSIEKSRTDAFEPFAPVSLPGHSSHTDVVLFYARSDETVMQIVQAAGTFQFSLALDVAQSEGFGPWDKLWRWDPKPLSFEMVLADLDHRAFTSGSGTVELHHKDWQTSVQSP
jgi:hypothetical protein